MAARFSDIRITRLTREDLLRDWDTFGPIVIEGAGLPMNDAASRWLQKQALNGRFDVWALVGVEGDQKVVVGACTVTYRIDPLRDEHVMVIGHLRLVEKGVTMPQWKSTLGAFEDVGRAQGATLIQVAADDKKVLTLYKMIGFDMTQIRYISEKKLWAHHQ